MVIAPPLGRSALWIRAGSGQGLAESRPICWAERKCGYATKPTARFPSSSANPRWRCASDKQEVEPNDFPHLEVSSGSRTAAIQASALHRLLYPDVVFGAGKIVTQTLRLPLKHLAELGVDLTDLRSIAFVFDRRRTGAIYVGDLQASN